MRAEIVCNENVFPLNVKFIYFVKPGQEIKTIYNGQRSSALTLYTHFQRPEATLLMRSKIGY